MSNEHKEVCAIEHAYCETARACSIDVPQTPVRWAVRWSHTDLRATEPGLLALEATEARAAGGNIEVRKPIEFR